MAVPTGWIIRFDAFELDTRSGELRKHGRRIRLPEQSFQVLTLLVAHPGQVVTRSDLRERLWPGVTAGDFDSGLNNAIKKLRDALGDSAESPRLIETLPRRGYRFLGKVEAPVPDPAPTPVAAVESAPAARTAQPAAPSSPALPSVTPPLLRIPAWPAIGILLLILVAGGAFYQNGATSSGHIRSIVVLPFDNLLGDASQNYFVDSVSAAVTTHLSEVDGLDVISRTSAQQFKGTNKRIPDIASILKVEGVVEGEVTRSAENVRITVKLIRASTDHSVWSETYEGSLGHMIPLQRRIASEVAVAAGRPRQPGVRRMPRSINPQAYDLYLSAMTAKGAQRVDGFRRAVAYLEQAIAIQPDFGEAHAELALVQLQFVFTGPYPPHELIPKAEKAAKNALRIDDTIGLAHFVLGRILNVYYWKWEDAEKEFRRAAELKGGPGSMPSASFARQGRFDEALAEAERARRLDPLSAQAQLALGNAYLDAGHYDRALEELRRALEMSDLPRIHFAIGQTFVAMGRFADAIPELESAMRPSSGLSAHNPRYEAFAGYAYAAAGRMKDARAMLTELEAHRRDQYVSSYGVALIHDALQERELALAALQRAYKERALEFAQMRHYPRFKAIASEPLFKKIIQSVGLPE
jgi:TolB-like protein/DNA-binding winged helix-turn-helix (wHTH) protein/tetratricopeptide (TPR) repeat protein